MRLRRLQAGFQFGDARFEGFEARAGACQHRHLCVELVAADQIELAEGARQQGLELGFQFGARSGESALNRRLA